MGTTKMSFNFKRHHTHHSSFICCLVMLFTLSFHLQSVNVAVAALERLNVYACNKSLVYIPI